MHNQPGNPDPSRLGTVEDVNGSSVSVKLSESTPGGLLFVNGEAYRVGQVGGFVRIPSGYVDLYGVISQVGAGAAPGHPSLHLSSAIGGSELNSLVRDDGEQSSSGA